jgi:cell division protein FtsA
MLVTGLDIGTTHTCCVVAELGENDELVIAGVGLTPSRGIKRGVVVDIEATTAGVEEAVLRASRQSGKEITSAWVSVSGEHLTSVNARGVTAVTNPDREVHRDDVERALAQAKVIVLPPDREILHVLARSFSIDGQNGIKQPVGMSGTRLEVETHIVSGAHTFLQNVEKCVHRAGLHADSLVMSGLAAAEAALRPQEREAGCSLVDIGGGSTEVVIIQQGEPAYSSVLPISAQHFTNDLAALLKITPEDAEMLKMKHGTVDLATVRPDETVAVQQLGSEETRQLPRRIVAEILEARMQDLNDLVEKELNSSGCRNTLGAGIVLTGGGARLHGAASQAAHRFSLPVRVASLPPLGGLGDTVRGPEFAVAVGLVLYGTRQIKAARRESTPAGSILSKPAGWFRRMWGPD